MNARDVRVVFMGSPSFAVPAFDSLIRGGYHVVGTVTQPDRPAGRGGRVAAPPVKQAALEHGIPVLQPATLKDGQATSAIASLRPDLLVVAAYGRILPPEVLELPACGALNVHASLLPRWRGPSPIAAAILAGDSETGVTIMEVVRKMDAGPIVSQARIPVGPGATTGQLESRLAPLGADTLMGALPQWLGGSLKATPQDDSQATHCPLLRKEDGWLDANMTAAQAGRAVRAYDPWPGAFVIYRGRRLGIWEADVVDGPPGTPGSIRPSPDGPVLALADGWLALKRVQLAGGRRVSGRDFLNGERNNLAANAGLRA